MGFTNILLSTGKRCAPDLLVSISFPCLIQLFSSQPFIVLINILKTSLAIVIRSTARAKHFGTEGQKWI